MVIRKVMRVSPTGELCRMAIEGEEFVFRNKVKIVSHASENWRLGGEASFGVQRLRTGASCVHHLFFFMLLLGANFSLCKGFMVQNTSYNWSSDIIFLGSAHATEATELSNNGTSQAGSLCLLVNDNNDRQKNFYNSGLAFYNKPVRLLDPSTRRSASFNTSFTVDAFTRENPPAGDGFTFVISAHNKTLGGYGLSLGIFDKYRNTTFDGTATFKSIVVEFDGNYNRLSPAYDVNNNHVGFDFVDIVSAVTANASTVDVWFQNTSRTYAWVEYSNQTQQLEVRVSNDNSRPISPLLGYTVDLFNVSEEYMWIGFSSGSGSLSSDYFVKNWKFESFGIPPASSPVPSQSGRLGLIVGVSVGAAALLLACVVILILMYRRSAGKRRYCYLKWEGPTEESPMVILEGMPERFSYRQLSVAAGNFSEDSKLGQGGFGSVHRGALPSGIPIAVKKINGNSTQGEKEFMAEVSIISRLRHRNLIQLLGWCLDASKGNYLLVYELMPNGSLDKVLFAPPEKKSIRLSWAQRFNIVMGTATAIDYLHQGWTQQVIHRDIKSSNIMLDEKWDAKLGDFGLARLIDHERTAATTLVAGTYGYIAPEVAVSGRFTDKTDVYAFGAVVLEIACGRKVLSSHLPEDEMLLVDWVWQRLSDGDLLSTVDKQLEEYDPQWMEVLLTVGLLCSHPNPLSRPTMKHVVQILSGDAPVPSIPISKPALVFEDDRQRRMARTLDSEKTWSDSTSSLGSISLASTNFLDSGTPRNPNSTLRARSFK